MFNSESIPVFATLAFGGLLDRTTGYAEPMQQCPRDGSRHADTERYEKRAREVEENFASTQRRGYPGKRHIQGTWHAADYAQSVRVAP